MGKERRVNEPAETLDDVFLRGVEVLATANNLSAKSREIDDYETVRLEAGKAARALTEFIDRYWSFVRGKDFGHPLESLERGLISTAKAIPSVSHYSWAGKAVEKWPEFLREINQEFWHKYLTELKDFFNLPEGILNLPKDVSGEEIGFLLGSQEARGLRFLPVYRLLEWEPKKKAIPVTLSLETKDPQKLSEKLWLVADDGRRFFLAAGDGVSGLEGLLIGAKKYLGISLQVTDVVCQNDLAPSILYALFDLDGTLRMSNLEGEEDSSARQRRSLLPKLGQRGMRIGLWTRNEQWVAEEYARRYSSESNVIIDPVYCFGHWPFVKENFRPLKDEKIQRLVEANGEGLGLSEQEKKEFGRKISVFLKKCASAKDLRYYIWEGKVPPLAALGDENLTKEQRRDLFSHGVIVNNDKATLLAALTFGSSFIYVSSPEDLVEVNNLI